MQAINKKNIRRVGIALIALLLIAVAAIAVAATNSNTAANADQGVITWCGENEVGISFNEHDLVSTQTVDTGNSVTVMIVCGVQNENVDGVKVRVRTRNGTAVAGLNYTAVDTLVTLRRNNFVFWSGEGFYFYDTISIKIDMSVDRLIVDGKSPYFDVELYDVLDEGFSISEQAKSVRVYIRGKDDDEKKHTYTTQYAFGTYMLGGYLCDNRVSAPSLSIYSEDKANQALSASYTLSTSDGNAKTFKKNYKDLGIADYYMGVKLKLDEKGVSLSSWCYLDLYDGSTSGLHLYHGEFRSIWDDDLKPGIYYEDMKHQNESFASGNDSFKDESEKYNRLQAYYFRVSSGTLYETFKNGSNYWRKTFGWDVSTIIIDDTAPQIKGWYVDKNTLQKGDKIRISVRFNEPLNATQTELRNVKLRAVFSGSGGFNNYNATFNCVNAAGSLPSDTLIFEFDPSQAKDSGNNPLIGTINNIEIAGFDNLYLIKDYGRDQNNNNNSCKNYNSLTALESDKMSPRQLRSDLKINFDNRTPVINQSASVSNEYVGSFNTTVTTTNTTQLQGTYYLWSQSPDLNYERVATPILADLLEGKYYEISGDSFVKSLDPDVVGGKAYYIPRAFNLAKTYEYLQIRNVSALNTYDDVRRYTASTPFDIGYSANGNFETTLSGVSGTYYLHVYAKTIYSDEASGSRRFGPIYVDVDAPEFSAITPDADSLGEKPVTVHVEELSGLKNIILYLREVGFDVEDAEAEVKKFLLYGTTDDTTVTVPEEGKGFNTVVDLANDTMSFTLSAEHHLGLSESGDKAYGDYYIGIVGTDLVGNTSALRSTDTKTSFDLRATFAPYVKIGGVDMTDENGVLLPANVLFYAENAYMVDISGGPKEIVIGRPGNINNEEDSYILSSAVRYENNVRVNLDYVKGTDYTVEVNSYENPYLSFTLSTPGYYEFITRAIFGEGNTFSKTVRFYVTNGNGESVTKNYNAIFNVGVNLKNKLFALSTSRYYSRTGTGMGSSVSSYYNDSIEPLLFSSKNKAIEYVKMMEYRDFYAVRLTDADVQAFANETITKDRSEPHMPNVGEVWIRYKSTTWNFSTNQRDWTYYYYGGATVSTTVDVNLISDSLASVVDKVTNIITQKGDWTYLTSQAGTNDNGALYVDPTRIPQDYTATTSAGTPSIGLTYTGVGTNPLVYTFDKNAYYDKYNDEDDVTLISSYKFSYLNTTKIYYAEAKYDAGILVTSISAYKGDYVRLTAPYLSQVVDRSGVYAVRELDENGMRDFFVYVDVTAPTISGQYTGIDNENHNNVWWTKNNDGDVLYTTAFAVSLMEDKDYVDPTSDNAYNTYYLGTNADTYSYIAVFDVTDGGKTLVASLTLTELKENNTVYELPYGIYIIEAYDRAGNRFSMTVSRAKTALTSTIEIVDNDNITFMVHDRTPSEIDKVYVTRPGMASQEIDFASESVVVTDNNGKKYYALVYTDAGQYDFTVIDKYGYTLSPSTDPDSGRIHTIGVLSRVNPSETVTWVTRSDDGLFTELDASDISLFRSDTYYITSDDKLTFVLDSTTIYSYAFTGNVVYKEIERTVEGKNYLYVNVDSTERWSVRIYYTLYPDVAVTYNRIAKRSIVPAAINLRALDKDSKGVAQADESNRIVVYVYTTDELDNNVTVRLRTRDRSAIASLGDYDETNVTVTLTPSEKEKMVTIQTHPSGISTYNSKTYEYANRTFDLFIDSVEGNAEKGKSFMECAVPGVQELNIVEKDGILVFEDYLTGAKHGLPNVAMDGKNSTTSNGSYDFSNDFSVSAAWLATYINSGLADLYVSGGMAISADDSSDSSALRITLTEKSTGKQLFRVYLNALEEHASILFGASYENKDEDDQPKVTSESYDKATAIKLAENRGNAVAGRYFYVPSTANGVMTLNVHEDEYTRVVHSQYGTYTYYVLPSRNLNDILGYSLLVDTTAPTIQSWHVDHNTITVGEKLRLSVRFSEPVYISGSAPYVYADVTGTSQSLTFTYAGGAGTDTLYFEFDPSAFTGEINVTGISLGNIKNYGSICDYAYNASKKNNVLGLPEIPKDTEWDNSCSLDTRIPRVDLDGTYVPSANPQRNATVPLNVSKVASGAELQYAWTVESDAPADYDKKITLTSSSQRVTIEAKGISGTYYLHVYIKSVFGKVTTETYGPFYFDNDMPTITGLTVEEATKGLKERNVTFYVSDDPKGQASSGVAQVYMYYLIKGEDTSKTLTLYDVNADDRTNIIAISDSNRVSFLLSYDMLGIQKEEQKDVTLAFYAVDGLGNSATLSTYTYCPAVVNFDARSEVGVTMQCDKGEFFNADSVPAYNVAGVQPNFDFAFSKQADEYDIRELYIGGKKIAENKYGDYIDYTTNIEGVHVTFKNNVVGFVRINFKAVTGAGTSHTVQESSDIIFYLTNGTDKAETANYLATESGTLLINKVYMLDAGSVYYYHNGEGVRQKNYNDTSKTMAFSSRAKAIEYVTYYEMQDLTTRQLTASEASALNVGDGNYRKASADSSVNASAGQVWIRYKRATWDRSESSNDWVYYYYGTSSEIDPERLPSSLSTAISQVAETIVSKGGYRYLTSADDYLDKNGAPYLDKKQIAITRLSTYLTNTGEEFRSVVVYEGDPDIYDSYVTPAGEEEPCSLVTTYNFVYGEYTKLFYTNQMDASGNPISKEFKLLPQGTVFGSLNIDGGVYWMRECDENGVRDFKVYLDKTAPSLIITYENAKGESIDRELDASVDGMSINGKVLKIKGFSATAAETDTMAYVAVFKKNGVQINVYRREDIPTAGIEIGEGQYYLEIADRSGNMYKISVSLNSTPMEVKVIAEENRHVRITCNRDTTEIKEFEIYLDNKLIESNYSSSVTYYQSGVYTIHIEDWFGNTFNYNYELKRELPKVNWFYDENDSYIAYDGTQSCMTINKTGEREYTIVTNKQLMFMYDTSADYEYGFSDRSLSVKTTEFNGNKRVRINDPVDWTVTIRYARYPEIYITYTCLMDTTPPIINVSARQDVVKYFDLQQIDALNGGGLNAMSSEYYVPDTVYFGVTKTISKAVRNNSSIYSTLITMQFDDKSVCSEVEIYLDGVMIREYKEGEGVNNITVNRFGEYRIVARDTLGNQSEFSFVNRASDAFKYIVDGKVIDTKLSPADSIEEEAGEYSYQADMYSFDNVEFMYGGSGKIVFWIEKDGEKHYLRYDCVDGALYEIAYRLVQQTDEEGNPVYDDNDNEIWQYQQTYISTVISDMSAVEGGKSFVLATEDKVGVNIFVRFDEEKNVFYRVDAPKIGEATVMVRIAYNDQYQPYFTKTVMSGELPEVTFEYVGDDLEEKRITPTSTEQIVYLNGGFFVAETAFANITEVSISYSTTTEFKEYRLIYTLNDGYEKVVFTEEGFYSIVAKNIYGRVAKYLVTMSNELRVIVTTDYNDDFATKHALKADTVYKANKQVTLDVYTDWIAYDVTFNGEMINDEPIEVYDLTGVCSILKKEAGTYRITIRDRFDNEVIVDFVIEDKPFAFKQEYLTGYNEDALRKNEGYSNKMLSLDADGMIADGIRYVTVIYGDTETVVFDLLNDEGTPVTEERITNAIGANGNGVYVLKLRNENGNVAETVLHYSGTPTLKVSRLIRTSREAEDIVIFDNAENKIYSNYSVTFETIASKYEIRVDGDKADMPLVIRYPSDGEDTGEYRQYVTYVDEYGFKYSFEINLVRKQLSIDLTKTMNIVDIDEVKMTRDDVSVEYDGSVRCEYTLDGGDLNAYQSGEKLTADGTYRFYLTDVAGNVHSASVRKDTLVEFTFLYAGTDRVVENGSVIMEGSARFLPVNNDSAKLDLVILNGEEYDKNKSTGFGERGKWEFLVSDDIGNKAYYYFYVLPYALSRFEYESPYAYVITEVTFDSGDGIPVSYTNMVTNNVNKKNSVMKFEETGTYQVVVSSVATAAYFTFNVVIDRTPPKAELVGASSGSSTTANVSLTGCVVGEVISVYKDGKLIETIEVTSSSTKMPEINEKGDYKIVITNAAGNEQTFEFTRKYTANVATTIVIMVFCLLIAIGLMVILVLRKRKKV